ncbi:MAG: hypothetical protein O6829_11145 [Alphaproteobacteria bacterium]|jgi:flagellar biosynthesis regulator FlaF|nr:hypothetical protein [Alphaproteobacteria bacterium]MCZ6606604.1 hypothetical protein [Alphaproteobacteria bacterium]
MTYENATEETLSISEEEAFGLSRAAVMLDQAKQNRADKAALATALNHNLELWVAIQGMVARRDNDLPESVKDNLISLGNYVADTTFKSADGLKDETIDTLININLQISEGLLEGHAAT